MYRAVGASQGAPGTLPRVQTPYSSRGGRGHGHGDRGSIAQRLELSLVLAVTIRPTDDA